jgi:hypothetical protein
MHGISNHSKYIFMCYLSKPSNTSHFLRLFLAHEDIVVGFAIFHIELSTPRLACFICSSLILQGSWSDHCNLNKKEKRHSSMVCESWWAPEGFGFPWFVKGKVGRSAKLYKRACICQFFKNSEPLSTCLVWKIARTPLAVIDRKQPPLKTFFISILQMKSSSTC